MLLHERSVPLEGFLTRLLRPRKPQQIWRTRTLTYSLRSTEWHQVVLVKIVFIVLEESEVRVEKLVSGLELVDGGLDPLRNTLGGVSRAMSLQLRIEGQSSQIISIKFNRNTYDVNL